jgi:hypothetical protein
MRAYVREILRRCKRSGIAKAAATVAVSGARLLATSMRVRRVTTPAGRQPPPQADFRRALGDLVERGTKILFIYSASMHLRFNHKNQFFELFPDLRGRIDVEYFGDADHVFTELSAQTRLIDTVASWISRVAG